MDSQNWEQIARYLANDDPQLSAEVQRKASQDPSFQRELTDSERIWKEAHAIGQRQKCTISPEKAKALVAKMAAHLPVAPAQNTAKPMRVSYRRPLHFAPLLKVAASVLLAVAVASIWYWVAQQPIPEIAYRETTAPADTHQKIVLADGSEIWLRAASTLRYPENFIGDTREVWLEGQAFFNIAQRKTQPFIVHAQEAWVEVVGTAFDLKAYPEEGALSVAVSEGLVRLGVDEAPLTEIAAQQQAIFNKQTQEASVLPFNSQAAGVWRNNVLSFQNQTLEAVAAELSRWYQVEVVLAQPELAEQHFTGEFEDKPLPYVLERIALALSIEFEQAGNRVVLKK